MAENVGSDESEFGSVTSSQVSFLKNSPFADPPGGVVETDSNSTEVLGTPISAPVTRTPILSLSTPMSLDSINDEDVFRTPPENASLSSAAESERRVRVSEIKPRRERGGSKLKSPSTTPVYLSPSLTVKNAGVLETNRIADPKGPVTEMTPLTSLPSFAAGYAKIPGGGSNLKSPSPVSASPSLIPRNVSKSRSFRRVPGKTYDSPSLDLDSSPQSASEGIKVTKSCDDDDEIDIPYKQVIEALLRNNGENLDARDERVSYVHILKRIGLKFP